jgi:adenylyltransferase/sulfurtransferase
MMSSNNDKVPSLRHRIHTLESELADLKRQLLETKAAEVPNDPGASVGEWTWPLDSEEYQRYGRQMIMRDIGLQGRALVSSAA